MADFFRETSSLVWWTQSAASSRGKPIIDLFREGERRNSVVLCIKIKKFSYFFVVFSSSNILFPCLSPFPAHCLPWIPSIFPSMYYAFRRANQLFRHNLTGLLDGALRACNAQFEPAYVLERLGVRLLEPSPGDSGWEVFSLDYAIDPPLAAVIHAAAISKYRIAFHMLWRLKRVEWALSGAKVAFPRRCTSYLLPGPSIEVLRSCCGT